MDNDDRLALTNNMLDYAKEVFLKGASLDTKERIIKEGLSSIIKEMINALNDEFKDVKFGARWGRDSEFSCMLENHTILRQEFWDEDDYNFSHMFTQDIFDKDPWHDHIKHTDLNDLSLKLEFSMDKRCSLGHKHTKHRCYVVNLAKLVTLAFHWKLNPPIRMFIKQHIPNFFYDPVLKRKVGRPRKIKIAQ